MPAKVFLDSNILIDLYSEDEFSGHDRNTPDD